MFLLDDCRADTGTVAYVPGSQRDVRFPEDHHEFEERARPMIGITGDAILFNGGCAHGWMPNESDRDCTAVILQYLPKFVRPMDSLDRRLPDGFVAAASPTIRRLLGHHDRASDSIDLPEHALEVPEPKRVPAPRRVSRRAMFSFGAGETDST